MLVTFFAEILKRGSRQLLSPTIPTALTRRSLPPLSAFRCKKRMLSQKERAESNVLAWRRALHCKEKNAVIEKAHGNKLLTETTFPSFFVVFRLRKQML